MALDIYTDGGCSGNPGPGGWAWVMVQTTLEGGSIIAEGYGGEKGTTNNRMELLAVISALKAYKEKAAAGDQGSKIPRQLTVHTDSQYVQKGITEWITKWKKNSWKTSDKKPVKNQDLWLELDALNSELSVSWEWVRGHAGDFYNERCDSMTQKAISDILSS